MSTPPRADLESKEEEEEEEGGSNDCLMGSECDKHGNFLLQRQFLTLDLMSVSHEMCLFLCVQVIDLHFRAARLASRASPPPSPPASWDGWYCILY